MLFIKSESKAEIKKFCSHDEIFNKMKFLIKLSHPAKITTLNKKKYKITYELTRCNIEEKVFYLCNGLTFERVVGF